MDRLLKASDLRHVRKGEPYVNDALGDGADWVKFRFFQCGRKYGVAVLASELHGTAEENASSIAASAGTLAQWQAFAVGGPVPAWESALPRTYGWSPAKGAVGA